MGRPSAQRSQRKQELEGLLDRPRTVARLQAADELFRRYEQLAGVQLPRPGASKVTE